MSQEGVLKLEFGDAKQFSSGCQQFNVCLQAVCISVTGGDVVNLWFAMLVQIFLQGKILGIEEFLLASPGKIDGRAHWVALLSEVLPRALLAELGLAKILLGSSGGEQFLVVLPIEARQAAEDFLVNASRHIEQISNGA